MVAVSESFHDMQQWPGGIDEALAKAILEHPDGSDLITLGGDYALTLVTKLIAEPLPNVVLLIGAENPSAPVSPYLDAGYRLLGTRAELDAMAASPRAALHQLTSLFGIEYTVAGVGRQRYIEQAVVPGNQVNLTDYEEPEFMSGQLWARAIGDGTSTLALAFLVNNSALRAAYTTATSY